ncbi:MAG: GNAT family N-acetyltransferase [Muribaculaceae bacterium]|nr:GNAT family N-acetyltransferase [Muribaculaceae bacterium]MDE7190474.1 GNAT family N-acetyltransferase [Muribaculaceae bacterium]
MDSPFFDKGMNLYAASFPVHEQRESESQRRIMSHPDYHFNLIFDDDKFVGLMLCWEIVDFIYVEHFCIFPELRNNNYGRCSLELLCRKGKTVILEIDPPIDGISERRKGFYERAGFVENNYNHTHPPYHTRNTGHELVVMSYPEKLSEAEYSSFNKYLSETVM